MSQKNLMLLVVYSLFSLGVSYWLGQQSYHWLPSSAAAEAEPVGDLLSFLTSLGSVVFLGVTGVLGYSLLFYRFSPHNPNGAPIRGNTRLEIIWTIIPIVLVTWIAWYSYHIYQRMQVLGPMPIVEVPDVLTPKAIAAEPSQPIAQSSESQPETIQVDVKQWSWTFTYPQTGVTSHELHLPVDRRVTLQMTSHDVLHGFYVPNFRIKQDIVPNRVIEFSFTPNRIGEYTLHDSQFSGTYFAVMTAPVLVQSSADFQAWLAGQTATPMPLPPSPALQEHQQGTTTSVKSGWPTVAPQPR